MLRLDCPFCGIRDEAEFHCGGDAHVVRPSPDATDAGWSDYLFNEENTKGIHFDRVTQWRARPVGLHDSQGGPAAGR